MGEPRAYDVREHVRDVTRRPDELQRCRCGHITRTIQDMRAHIVDPRAELVSHRHVREDIYGLWFGDAVARTAPHRRE